MELGFVFTNFNNSLITKEAIHSILMNNNLCVTHVIVVDNNSNEENIELLNKIKVEYPNVHIIYNSINVGYFSGLNLGIEYLRNNHKNLEYIVIGNNDLLFPSNFIDLIKMNFDTFKKHPVISPDIVTMDGVHQNPHVIEKISKIREIIYDLYYSNYYLAQLIKKLSYVTKFFTDRKDEEQFEIAQAIYQGYGACYILGPLFFKNFDLLWAPTFLMGEEFFFSKQLESKGFRFYYEPSITVNHLCHATMDKMPSKKIWKIARDSHKEYRKYVKIWK